MVQNAKEVTTVAITTILQTNHYILQISKIKIWNSPQAMNYSDIHFMVLNQGTTELGTRNKQYTLWWKYTEENYLDPDFAKQNVI